MTTKTIRLENVSKRFSSRNGETLALSPINLEIEAGSFVAVVGPSGCGKSTLMRLIAGLVMPTSGTIHFDDELVRSPRPDTGIVFQRANLAPWRDVLGNVALQIQLRKLDWSAYREKAVTLLRSVGLGDFLKSLPHELSGGMQQRASIARALVHAPQVLLMDEPFGALDALTREQVRIDLENLWMQDRMSVLFITHSIDEAVLLADRVVVMSPRPGAVDTILDIDLPRPRGLAARRSPEFVRFTERITDMFMSRGVLDDRHAKAGNETGHRTDEPSMV